MTFTPAEEQRRGKPWVWYAVAAVILFLAASQLYEISTGPDLPFTPDRKLLQKELSNLEKEMLTPSVLATGPNLKQEIEQRAEQRLGALSLKTKGAQGARARAILILRQAANPETKPDFSGLNTETDDITDKDRKTEVAQRRKRVNYALIELYTSKSLSPSEAKRIKNVLATDTGGAWPVKFALDRVDQLSGAKEGKDVRYIMAGLAVLIVLAAGVGAWIAFFVAKSSGAKPSGIPLAGQPSWVGDALAMRFLGYVVIFELVPPAIATIIPGGQNNIAWLQILGFAAVAIVSLLMLNLDFGSVRISLKNLGWRSSNLAGDILWGMGAWLANWPVILLLAGIGARLFSWIPSGEHPLQRELLAPQSQLPALIGAALFAPLLEETFFRGCLFQGLALRLKNLPWSIVLSSVAFAAIHPQGGALWLPLAWVGAMGCFLTYQRGSIVPAVVMHCLHNASIILAALYLG